MKEIAEALTEAQTLIEKIHTAFADSQDDILIHKLRKTLSVINSALAKPLRNCDVGDANEQIKRHKKWCATSKDFSCSVSMCRECYAKWAQMLYKEEVKNENRS